MEEKGKHRMSFYRISADCNGCLACVQNCPAGALNYMDRDNNRKIFHNMSLCARCGNCWRICPQDAVEFDRMLRGQWDEAVSMELVHCKVCGEPIYTSRVGQNVAERLDKNIESLCPRHKRTVPLNLWKRIASSRKTAMGGER